MLAGDEGEIRWSLSGERRRRPEGGSEGSLELTLDGSVRLPCVRCLDAVDVAVHETRRYRLALSEAQAEREDLDSEEVDVIVGGQHFDVLELVEDETIMALPFAPSHDACGLPADVAATDSQADEADDENPPKRNPFAVLEQLKRGPGRGDS